jgi:hypothetical protein
MKVIANGETKDIPGQALSFFDVVRLCVGDQAHPAQFSVTFRGSSGEGILIPSRWVEPVEGMVFNAYVTSRA